MSSKLSIIFVWVAVIVLLVMGLVMVASTGVWAESEAEQYTMLTRQSVLAAVGLVGAIIISRLDYRKFRPYVWGILGAVCVLLALCFVPGIGREINGEYRWIEIAGQRFQPSECAKLAIMMALAHWYSLYRDETRSFWKGFVFPSAVFGFPVMLIFVEKDMGTASALGIACLCVMFVAGARFIYLFLSGVAGTGFLYLMVQASKNRMLRIEAWKDLEAYKDGVGLQQYRAIQAMEHGGLMGTGLGNSVEKHGTLPFAHTDFIFAVVGEEFGLIGSLVVVLCFSLLMFFGLSIALQTTDRYGKLLAVGIVGLIFCPAILNITVVTGLVPNSGLPLPFISYGGTNLIFTLAAVGMLTSIQQYSTPPISSYKFKRRSDKTTDLRL